MKKVLLIFFSLGFCFSSFAQTEFEQIALTIINDSTGIFTPQIEITEESLPIIGVPTIYAPILSKPDNSLTGLNATYTLPTLNYNNLSGASMPQWITFSAHTQDYPGLMLTESGSIDFSGQNDNFSYSAYVGAVKYEAFNHFVTSYYIGGQATYYLNQNFSATIFGAYYTNSPYFSMASYPYIQTTNFGGYMTISPSSKFSLSLGAKSYYDPFSRRMEVDPIIAPTFKVGKVRIGVDVGHAAKQYLSSLFQTHNK